MTSIRYLIPLTIEANKRGIKSRYFIFPSRKYHCPKHPKNYKKLEECSRLYNFTILSASQAKEFPGVFFLVEGDGSEFLDDSHKKISITYMTDFIGSYNRYIDSVDSVVMPNKYFAEYYDRVSDKNLYLGSPKYDTIIDKQETIKKYNLTNNKKALFVFPRIRDLGRIDLLKLYDLLRKHDFEILVKTRGKDSATTALRGDYYVEDESWFPHATMELISISDLIINFDSTVIKECIMLKKPVINFHIKPFDIRLDFLYNYQYCKMLQRDYEIEEVESAIKYLMSEDLSLEFDAAIEKYLFEKGNVSAKILDHFGINQ